MIELLLWPWLGSLLLALACGPLGTFMVWRRMAYFGDTLAHGALLGVALGWILQINITLAVVIFSLVLAVILSSLLYQRAIAADTLLGILSHGSLATGLLILSFFNTSGVNLSAMLLGDLLSIGAADLLWMGTMSLLVLGWLWYFWQPLLNHTISPELAHVEGVNIVLMRTLLFTLIALVVAMAIKIVGVLLITSLLIIPAAAARRLSSTPEQMAIFASLLGCFAVTGGIGMSWWLDTPTGPSIVVIASVLFLILHLAPMRKT